MSTKSLRSSGSQHNTRGVTQGNTLVGPQSGLPIHEIVDNNGIRRLAVDANISATIGDVSVELDYTSDSVAIGDPNTQTNLKINANGSIDANVEVSALSGDNIAISDGTNNLLINADGSINIKMQQSLPGPAAQVKLTSVGTTSVVEVKAGLAALANRQVITMQPSGNMKVYFGDGTIPSAATVMHNGFDHFKNSKETYEVAEQQQVFILAASGIIDVIIVERS
jgi:hypothetical protein